MDTEDVPSEGKSDLEGQGAKEGGSRSLWDQSILLAVVRVLDNPGMLKGFFNVTGGSILYCLSALCILYGIGGVVTPLLAKSNAFRDALPCIVMLNVYELALLGVLVTIVAWKNVTDDAISLVVLVAVFLITSGIVLGTGAYFAPRICFYIGLGCIGLGLGKLYAMRRFVSFQIGRLSVLGMMVILGWNFLTSSVISGCFAKAPALGATYRKHWLVAWLVLLAGGLLIVVDAARSKRDGANGKGEQKPFLQRRSMVWVFAVIVLAAASIHQHAIAYMYRVYYVFGDHIPLIGIGSLLLLELIRSLGKRFGWAEVVVSCLPLVCTLYAVLDGASVGYGGMTVELLWYPPIMLGLTGAGVLWLSVRHRWPWLLYVVAFYVLALLLTVGYSPAKPHDLNWHLCGGGLVVMLLILGVVHRNVLLCFGAVIVLAGGLGLTDAFVQFAEAHGLTAVGATGGVAGLGIMVICLGFGRKVPRFITVIGAVSLVGFVFDYLPAALAWNDIAMATGVIILCSALWVRTRDIAGILILCIPVVRKLYILLREMSYWGFIVLSFLLLFLGGIVSLFCKRRKENEAS